MGRLLETEWTLRRAIDEAFAAHTIRDEQLRMMFSCCHPRLPEEVQIALILNILCGFGAHEIAGAFLTSRAAIEKRIARGKKVLAGARRLFDLTDAEFAARLSAVRRALYLLFNEGYHGASREAAVRAELCAEAMRLTALLREYPPAATPDTDALAALMCLHAARLPARVDAAGDLQPLFEQDRSRWDARLVAQGLALLERSAAGDRSDGVSRRSGDRRGARQRADASRRPTGRRSSRSTIASWPSRRRRSSRSTARSPSASATAPGAASRSCPRSPIATGWPAIRSIRRRSASSSCAAAITWRRGDISRRRLAWPETRRSGGSSRSASGAAILPTRERTHDDEEIPGRLHRHRSRNGAVETAGRRPAQGAGGSGLKAWREWATANAAAIVDEGSPVGKTKRVSREGISDVRNNIAAYVVVQAESHEAAARLFENHPHFTTFPGDAVEIMEFVSIPKR